MAEFFVYVCRQCGHAYAGALEAGERPIGREDSTGLCPECLTRLFELREGGGEPAELVR